MVFGRPLSTNILCKVFGGNLFFSLKPKNFRSRKLLIYIFSHFSKFWKKLHIDNSNSKATIEVESNSSACMGQAHTCRDDRLLLRHHTMLSLIYMTIAYNLQCYCTVVLHRIAI